ncbi:MAG: hypothetical protein ACRC8A_10040 [Microcoleaceae cyanobacterium]
MIKAKVLGSFLSYDSEYPCPVCRCGQLSGITLMEAFGCNTCRHLFTVGARQNQLKIADREPAITWQWNGQTWQGEHIGNLELSWIYWLAAAALVCFPPSLIGLTALIFPPPGGGLAWFPIIWTGVAFLAHLSLVLWLVTEAYQFPVLLYLKVRWQQWFQVG